MHLFISIHLREWVNYGYNTSKIVKSCKNDSKKIYVCMIQLDNPTALMEHQRNGEDYGKFWSKKIMIKSSLY